MTHRELKNELSAIASALNEALTTIHTAIEKSESRIWTELAALEAADLVAVTDEPEMDFVDTRETVEEPVTNSSYRERVCRKSLPKPCKTHSQHKAAV